MKTNHQVTVGVFDSRAQADRAVQDLRAAGFEARTEPVSGNGPGEVSGTPTWENGAGVGGLTGAALGGLAAGPPGMAAGALTGLLLGTLIDLGIPEQDARWYSDEAESGRTVVTVRTEGRADEVWAILGRHGARQPAGGIT